MIGRRFANYERPDGWTIGEPEVLASNSAIKRLGMPVVNYPSLHRLLTDGLSIPYDQRTRIRLYGRTKYGASYGHHIPFTDTIHVNVVRAEKHLASKGGAMAIVGHEGLHRADSSNHRAAVGMTITGRLLAVGAAYELGHLLNLPEDPTFSSLAPYAAVVGATAVAQLIDPAEIRARRREKSIIGSEHETDILFPNSPRTEALHQAGRIPLQALEVLGLMHES